MELFTGRNNFSLWQSMAKDILIQQGLHDTLEDSTLEGVEPKKWSDMKLRAVSTIRLALAPKIKYTVLEESDPKALWEKLAKMFESKPLANKLFLKDLLEIRMEAKGDLREHLNKFNGLITQLACLDETFKSEDKAIMLSVSLPKEYNTIRTSLLWAKQH